MSELDKERVEEFFQLFDHSKFRCDCGQFCHKDGSLGANNLIDRKKVPNYFKIHMDCSLTRSLSVLRYPYKIEQPIDPIRIVENVQKSDMPKDEICRYTVRQFNGPNTQLVLYSWFMKCEAIPYVENVPEEVITGYQQVEVDEAIYEDITKTKEIEERVPIHDTKIITEKVRVETPRTKKINKPVYNTWSKQWEPHYYTECYTDVSYKDVQKVVPNVRYEIKKKQVSVSERVQVGTRQVTKEIPITETVYREVTKYRQTGKYLTFPFNLTVTTTCPKCNCFKCKATGWLPWSK